MKVLVAGAGVAGLAIGWRLAQAGVAVEVIERGRAGKGATWAAAGMIAPLPETGESNGDFVAFAKASRAAWPSFASGIEAASGMTIRFRVCGSLLVAANEVRARELRERGQSLEWLGTEALLAREPLLSEGLLGALSVRSDAQVDNRLLGEALRLALLNSGARLCEGCDVVSLIVDKNRVRGLMTTEGPIEGDAVVMATGAWLNGAGGDLPRIAPVKGQMIALEPPSGTQLPKQLVWNEDIYLVPRGNRLLAGATVEDAGFDTSVTREARDQLFDAVCRVIPSAREWRIAECWAGLRPKSDDAMPVLGETKTSGLFTAGGQFRSGILFAPMVADALTSILLGKNAQDLLPFDPKRFGRT